MPWLTIAIMLISFFLTKKKTGSNTKAALVAGLAGAGSYFVTHETDWGRANLGALDGVSDVVPAGPKQPGDPDTPPEKGPDGKPVRPVTNGGKPITGADGSVLGSVGNGITDVLTSWGGAGTAAVIGTTAVATDSKLKEYLPWILGGVALFLVLK